MLRAAAASAAVATAVTSSSSSPPPGIRAGSTSFSFREIGSFKHKNPAVCAFSGYAGRDNNTFPGSKSVALFTTSFDALTADEITVITDFGATVTAGGSYDDQVVETSTPWPNMVTMLPEAEFSAPSLLVAGGFLVPGKTTGSVDVFQFDEATGSPTPTAHFKVSTDKKGFFYHNAVMHDMDGDGDNDIVAARATDPTVPWEKKAADLIWLERPADPTTGAWTEHVLYENGPDVYFLVDDFDNDGKFEVIATEFFVNARLALYSCSEANLGSCSPSTTPMDVVVIDDTNGPFFSVQRQDLNGDGNDDLLVTNNRDDGKGAVFAYEIPTGAGQLNNASAWPAPHTLASGYKPPASLAPGKGAPGTPTAFFPQVPAPAGAKPFILLSGDDSGVADLLTPSATSEWTYDVTRVANVSDTKAGGTVGSPAIADTDGDGYVEFVVPLYSDSVVKVFTFAPQPTAK